MASLRNAEGSRWAGVAFSTTDQAPIYLESNQVYVIFSPLAAWQWASCIFFKAGILSAFLVAIPIYQHFDSRIQVPTLSMTLLSRSAYRREPASGAGAASWKAQVASSGRKSGNPHRWGL